MRKLPLTASLLAHAAAIGGAVMVGAAAAGGVPQVSWQARCEISLGSEVSAAQKLVTPVVPLPVLLPAAVEPSDQAVTVLDPAPLHPGPETPLTAPESEPVPMANGLLPGDGTGLRHPAALELPAAEWVKPLRAPPTDAPAPVPPELAAAAEAAPSPTPAGGAVAADAVPATPDESQNLPPEYPLESRRRGEEGTVLVRLQVDPAGKVIAACVARSSGHARLDRSALAALERWVYHPAQRDGVRVAGQVEQLVVFRLDAR